MSNKPENLDNYFIHESSLSRLEERRNLLLKQNWIVDKIFEKGEIHFISGPSGVGKTSWFYKFIRDWTERKLIFGKYQSHPSKYAYIVCDRSFLLSAMTLERLGMAEFDIKIFTIDELMSQVRSDSRLRDKIGWTFKDIQNGRKLTLGEVSILLPWADVLFVDAIGWFDPIKQSKQMSYTQALNYWSDIRDRVTSKGKTIVATTHSPKAKGTERYGNPRDRVMGTVGTMGSIATVINIEFKREDRVSDPNRIINISARNIAGLVYNYKFDDNGDFVYCEAINEEGEVKDKKEDKLDNLKHHLERIGAKVGEIFKGPKLIQLKDWVDCGSDATWFRLLELACEDELLEMKSRGVYEILKRPSTVRSIRSARLYHDKPL